MKVNALKDDLSEADLAVFGAEDREEMAMLAGVDTGTNALASLPDRQTFLAEAARHVAHARRSKHPLCLALIAFVHGTTAQGAEGHAAEEKFLREATARWRDVLRTEDLLGRWGEDEFAIVLVNCQTASASQLCWRLRESTPGGAFVFGRPRVLSGDGNHRRSRRARRRLPRAGDCQGPRPDGRRGLGRPRLRGAGACVGVIGREALAVLKPLKVMPSSMWTASLDS